MSLVYPKIPHDEKKSVKIKLTDIPNILRLYEQGISTKIIAEEYNVSQTCIYGKINPEFYQKQLEGFRDRYHNSYKYDKEYLEKNKKQIIELQKTRRRNDKKFRSYSMDKSSLDSQRRREEEKKKRDLSNFKTFAIDISYKHVPNPFRRCAICQVWIESKNGYCPSCGKKLKMRKDYQKYVGVRNDN